VSVKIRKAFCFNPGAGSPDQFQSFYFQLFTSLLKLPRKGTSPAFLYIAQQLGNGAIVERLCSGRSFFGVRARGEGSKGYAEKGAPTKQRIPKSLAAAGND
jgi:hypothetical protein